VIVPRDDIARLERVGDATWPALHREWYDGWVLRYADGVTGRSNSASTVEPGVLPLHEKVAEVERRYQARGLTPTFRLTPLTDRGLDDLLNDLGYGEDAGADVMSVLLRHASIDTPSPRTHARMRVERAPSAAWLGALSAFGDDRGRPDVLRAMLEGLDVPSGYVSIADGGRIVAIGMGAVAHGVVAVFNMNTDPAHRRAGLGRQVLSDILAWGGTQGATEAMLQVRRDNAQARALYRSAGFTRAYSYTYRRPAASG